MTETTEQIQTPALPESLVMELPAQTPPEVPQPDGASQEAVLGAEIAELWLLHTDYKDSIKNETENLRALRAELGQRLAQMKQLLAKPGCGGLWSSWLKEHKIARSTADRLVTRYERSLIPEGNRLTESISEPTEEEIKTLLDKIAPKLRQVLRTPTSVYTFINLVASSFEGLDRRVTEEGLVVLRPSVHKASEQSAPDEAQNEPMESPIDPVPVVTDVQVESDSESMGI